MLWRRIKKSILYFLVLLIVLIATLVTLIETSGGSHWLVRKVATYANIQLGDLRGDLRHGLDVEWLEYKTPAQSIRAENLRFRWNSTALLYTFISVNSFSVDSLNIQLNETENKKPAPFNKWPDISLPFRVELKQFHIRNIQIQQGDYQDQWQELSGSFSLGALQLRYSPLKIIHKNYQLELQGISEGEFPYKTEAKVQWLFIADTTYQGNSQIRGDLYNFFTNTQVNSPFKASAFIDIPLVDADKTLQTAPNFNVQLTVEKQLFPQVWWMENHALPEVEFTLAASGNWNSYNGELKGLWAQPDLPPVDLLVVAKGDWQKIQLDKLSIKEQREINSENSQPISELLVSGSLDWLPMLKWKLDAKTDFFNAGLVADNWPTRLKGQLSTEGEKTSTGWLWKIDAMDFDGSVRDLAFSLKGNLHQDYEVWQSEKLELIWGANRFTLSGYLSQTEKTNSKVVWDLQAPLLGQMDDQLSGSFSSKGILSGSWSLPQITAEANADSISWQNLSLKKLSLVLKPLEEVTQVTSEPAEQNSITNTAGILQAQNAPARQAILDQQYQLQFAANQLQMANQTFKSIQMTGSGSLADHQLLANIRHARLGRLDMDVIGKLNGQEWIGNLQKFSIKIKNVPKWWLNTSRPVHISPAHLEVEPICFTTRSNQTAIVDASTQVAEDTIATRPFYENASNSRAKNSWLGTIQNNNKSSITILPAPELCVDFKWQAETGMQLDADLHAVPLRQFLALFKPEVFFAGVMNGYFRLHTGGEQSQTTQAVAYLETRDAELRYQYEGGVTEVYPWKFAVFSSELNNSQLLSDLRMEWTGYGGLKTNAHLALDKQEIVQAGLEAAFDNLQPLETLLPFMDDVKGQFTSSLKASGSLDNPQFSGYVKLDDASARIPKLGVSLSKISASVSADDRNQLNLMANATAGKGSLSLQGVFMSPLQDNWQLVADLNGQNFQILNLLSIKANINPAIHLDATAELIKLTGEAEVPYMRANIKTIPQSAISVSDDVILVNEKTTTSNKETETPIYANLRLRLGDDVEFKGFGLDSKLSGDLKLLKETQRPWLTNGFVGVKEGSYQAYGQALTIERGQLIFQGDYENPGLDIRASRVIADDDNTKVGLEIAGTLQRPRAKVYSQPAHSDSNAMMMLLTGKPLSEASKADASVLVAALGGLGVERSQSITQDVAQFFGVDELSIKADKGFDQSQLWVGKYLTPRVLVRYVVGLFDQAFSFGVVYRLTDRVRIEAESGETQSLDMIYKIEK